VPKTLVTGGAGFIGSHVARALAERGDELRLTMREQSNQESLAGLEFETAKCDLLDRRAVRRALRNVDRVFHVAGLVSLRKSDEEMLYRVNVDATRIVMEESLKAGVERVVYTSSVAAIGPAPPGGTADETQVFDAGDLNIPYVTSKHEGEVEALRVAAHGLPVVCVNPCVVMGAGDVYGGSTQLVRRYLLGRIPAFVDGGMNVVDVNDVAQGHLLADRDGAPGERYILGNRNYTLARLFAELGRISGIEPPALRLPAGLALALAELAERAPGRPVITVNEIKSVSCWWTYKNNKAKRELGWRTTPHEDTLEATVNWYLEREGDRVARARRSQPYPYKAAAFALSAAERAGGLASRLLGRGS
jgi:dihydroflavonol-4-reductase